jgi:general secretion pathway protein N
MKKWFILGAVFFVSYLVFIVSTLPLAFIINHSELPKSVTIEAVSGTLWKGEIAQITIDKQVINKVETQLSFWSIFTLTPKVDMTFGSDVLNGPQGKLTLAVSQSTLQLTDVSIFLNANTIASKISLPVPVPITAKGEVEFQLSDMTIALDTYQCSDVKGQVHWARASVIAMENNVKLGKLSADLDCEKGKLLVKFLPKNDIGLNFSAFVSVKGQKVNISGNGYLKPGVNFPTQLKLILPFLGKPDAKGRYRLKL